MRYEKMSLEIIEQKADESTGAFAKRVNDRLTVIEAIPDTRGVFAIPTQSIGGLFTYHINVMTTIQEPEDYKKWNDEQETN